MIRKVCLLMFVPDVQKASVLVIYYTKLEFLPNIFYRGDDSVLFLSVALFTNWFSEDDHIQTSRSTDSQCLSESGMQPFSYSGNVNFFFTFYTNREQEAE